MTGSDPNPIPSRQERKTCHAKRDEYFACLDKHNIANPVVAGTVCEDLRKLMYEKCPEAWADYFQKLRVMKRRQERLYQDRPLEGKK
ncbi:hypothetical protein IWW50_001918 [Coemansia erecta]|nr:hypothetical protein GGF43_002040 [Coemansia sp. RSA 2618]KAJ2827384.1 hypothetical protein IWW50_001918 [Coemansia erecta]